MCGAFFCLSRALPLPCAGLQGGECTPRRIWPLVNLSLRISQTAVQVRSTCPAAHHHRLPGCLLSAQPGVTVNLRASASADYVPILEKNVKEEEENQRKIGRRKSCKNSTFSTKLPLSPGLHTASPTPLIPALPHFLLQASRTFIRLLTTVYIAYMSLLLFYMNAVCLHYTKLLSVQTGCIMVHYLLL